MEEFEKNKIVIFLIWGIAAIIATLCTLDFDTVVVTRSILFVVLGIYVSGIASIFIYNSALYLPTLIKIAIVVGASSIIFSFMVPFFSLSSIFTILIAVLAYALFDYFEKDEKQDEIIKKFKAEAAILRKECSAFNRDVEKIKKSFGL